MRSKFKWTLVLFMALIVQVSFAQEKTLTGVVTESGMPLPGATVIVKGTQHGTQTDLEGHYTLKVNPGDVLVFSFIGLKDVNYTVGAANSYNASLVADDAMLEELIVVGYGTATKESFTGTATQISSEKIERKAVSSAAQALAGESAGVRVINSTGQPGSEPTIRIRGFGSVNGNRSPLFIVDGVPYLGNVSAINPADIESMSVLKDATATAIYGTRGANGVVIINTKSGRGQESFIEVETRTGTNFNFLPRYDVVKSPEEFIGYTWEGMYNRGVSTQNPDPVGFANNRLFGAGGIDPHYNMWNVANGGELIDPETGMVRQGVTRKYTPENWEDYAFQSSRRTEANLKMGGSSDKTSYFTSLGYLKDEGYSINSDYERLSARLNLQHKPKDWLSARMNIGYALSESNSAGQTSDSGSIFWFIDNMPSIYPLYLRDADGKIVKDEYRGGNQYDYGEGRGFAGLTNSIADATLGTDRTKRHEINMNSSFDVNLYDGLTFETSIGGQYYNNSYDSRNDRYYGSAATMGGSIYKQKQEMFTYNFLKLLRYKQAFGSHGLEVLAAHESNYFERKVLSGSKNDLADPNGLEFNNAAKYSQPYSWTDENAIESYFAQVNYDFAGKYFISGTVRRDGSSKFVNDKWGTFGSVGAAWVVSREDFMMNQNVFSNLKLKASYGLTGDQESYRTIGGSNVEAFHPGLNLWEVTTFAGELALYEDKIGNPDLTWETSKMFQVGVEFALGKYIDASVDYYVKNTEDLIFDRRVGPSSGFAILTVNDGSLRNQGLEFDVTAHLLKTKDAYIDLSINGETFKNRLTSMPIEPGTGLEKNIDINGVYGRAVGHSLGDFYIREWKGVDPQTGKGTWKAYTYLDENGNTQYVQSMVDFMSSNPNTLITETTTDVYQDAVVDFVGKSVIPKVRGGINLAAGYKGFDLSVQVLYSLGGYAMDSKYATLMHSGAAGSNNWHKDIADRWQKEGDVTNVPRLSDNVDRNVSSSSTRFLTKADYLSINNIRLGYTLPKTYSDQLKVSSLGFYVSADNLWLFSKRDGFNPSASEFGSSSMYAYAPLTTITAGVNLKF